MRAFRFIIFGILAGFSFAGPSAQGMEAVGATSAVTILTYNAALLNKSGVDLVPCVAPRTRPQASMVFRMIQERRTEAFVIALQEVWTREGFAAYFALAHRYGYSVTPAHYEDVRDNGEMMITNLKVTRVRFQPFRKDSHVHRGFRVFDLETSAGPLEIVDLHTSYSDSVRVSPIHLSQFFQLAQFLDSSPARSGERLIVVGDFNAGPNIRYIHQKYDPAAILWRRWLEPIFGDRGFTEASYAGDSWDEANPLVSNPAAAIKVANFAQYGIAGWEELNGKLDHIFLSRGLRTLRASLALQYAVDLGRTCAERSDGHGRTMLSDHFAVWAEVGL